MRLALVLLETAVCIGTMVMPGRASASSASSCAETPLSIKWADIRVRDRFVSSGVHGPYPASRITFAAQSNPLKGKRIIAVEPLAPTLLLDDGSAVTIARNVDGDGSIKGAGYQPVASCHLSDWAERKRAEWAERKQGRRDADVEIGYLGHGSMEKVRIERVGNKTRLSRLVTDESGKRIQAVAPLIVANRRIEALGVVPRPIDSPGNRVLITVAREADNTIIIVAYQLP